MMGIDFENKRIFFGSTIIELNTTRNKIILGSVLLGFILIIFITSASHSASQESCVSIDQVPGRGELIKIKSDDYRALVIFYGYLIYAKAEKTLYLPLELKSVGVGDLSLGNKKLTLNTDCSTLELDFVMQNDNSSNYAVKEMRVDLNKALGDNKICTVFKESLDISLSKVDHYACYESISYYCHDHSPIHVTNVASIVIQALELEIDGEKQIMKERIFSTPKKQCKRF